MAETASETKSWLTDAAITALLVAGFTILLSIVLSEIQTKVGWVLVAITLAFVLIILGSLLWLVMRPLIRLVERYLDSVQVKLNPDDLTWLIDTDKLVKYENSAKTPEIWLLTSDLLDDSQGGPFALVVAKKLAKGTKYVYFVPNTPEARARIQALFAQHGNSPHLRVVFLPDSFFFLVPKLDIAIYNPFSIGSFPRQAFMGVPVPDEARHYHASISADLIDKIVGTLLPEYKKVMGEVNA